MNVLCSLLIENGSGIDLIILRKFDIFFLKFIVFTWNILISILLKTIILLPILSYILSKSISRSLWLRVILLLSRLMIHVDLVLIMITHIRLQIRLKFFKATISIIKWRVLEIVFWKINIWLLVIWVLKLVELFI